MKIKRFAGMTVAVLAIGSSLALALDFPPKPHQLVNDNANMMTPEDRAALETELRAYNTKTSTQVAVLTVSSLDGMDVDEYANQLFHQWGIGKKGDDNGVLLLYAPTEKKVRIEVGYGLEGDLNDAKAGDIIRNVIHPLFESGNRSGSVVKGAEAVMADLGDTPYPSRVTQKGMGMNPFWIVACLVLSTLGLLVLMIVFRRRNNDAPAVESNDEYRDGEFERTYPHLRRDPSYSSAAERLRRYESESSSSGVDALAAGVAAASLEEDRPSSSKSSDDDSPSSTFSDPSPSSNDDSSPSPSFDFGGGDSGGGGASGDL